MLPLKLYPRPNRRNLQYVVSQTNKAISIPYFRLEILENDTLWGGTNPYGLYSTVYPMVTVLFGISTRQEIKA